MLSLLVSKKAKGLFHKAISQSGYTTSISPEKAYRQSKSSPTSEHTSQKIVNKLLEKTGLKSKKISLIQRLEKYLKN